MKVNVTEVDVFEEIPEFIEMFEKLYGLHSKDCRSFSYPPRAVFQRALTLHEKGRVDLIKGSVYQVLQEIYKSLEKEGLELEDPLLQLCEEYWADFEEETYNIHLESVCARALELHWSGKINLLKDSSADVLEDVYRSMDEEREQRIEQSREEKPKKSLLEIIEPSIN